MKKRDKILQKIKFFPKRFYYRNKKFIWMMVTILLVGNAALFIKNYQQQKAFDSAFPVSIEVTDFNEYMETQKDVPSDIEGLSVYDKYTMGLQRQDGSDSDYDGLTDKEEIEIYGTDPLKASSAGDLYTDAYKVQNGLDPFTYMEYTGEIAFPYSECEEVYLTVSSPIDFNAVVFDCTVSYDLSSFDIGAVYKGYDLYNYAGSLKMNVHDVLAENNINEFEVYVTNGPFIIPGETELSKCSYELDGDVAALDYEFEHGNEYLIFLAEKQGFSINGLINSIVNQKDTAVMTSVGGKDKGEALMYASPLLTLFGTKITVYYTECANADNTELLKNEATAYMDDEVLGGKQKEKKYKVISQQEMERKKDFYNKFLRIFGRYPRTDEGVEIVDIFINLFFCYSTYENTYEIANESSAEFQTVSTGFDKYWDELPFQNFRSYIGAGGNCAGITHLTSYLYNTGSFPASGTYNRIIDNAYQEVSWNLSMDSENATLTDLGLFDYKTIDFITQHSDGSDYLNMNLTEGEQEFVNMIGCFWSEANDRVNMNAYEKATGEYYDISLLNRMTSLLDQGKVLDVYLYMRGGGAHAVNIYGYKYVDDRCVWFMVYDNNIPQDCKDGYMVNTDGNGNCFLQVMIRKDGAGNDILEYLYMPLAGSKNYIASSMKNLMPSNAMMVMDESWNVLN